MFDVSAFLRPFSFAVFCGFLRISMINFSFAPTAQKAGNGAGPFLHSAFFLCLPWFDEVIEIFFTLSHVRAMPVTENPADASALRPAESRRHTEPCSIVIFGASGDLTVRKLILFFTICSRKTRCRPLSARHRFRAPRKDRMTSGVRNCAPRSINSRAPNPWMTKSGRNSPKIFTARAT